MISQIVRVAAAFAPFVLAGLLFRGGDGPECGGVRLHYRHQQLVAEYASALAGHVGVPVTILAGDSRIAAAPGESPDVVMAKNGIPSVSTEQLPEDLPMPDPGKETLP